MLDKFEKHLRQENLSENTISAYLLTIRMYQQLSGEITKQNLLAFKGYLMETYKPKTVNLRIQAINKYLEFIKKEKLRLSPVKIQQKNFFIHIIMYKDNSFTHKQNNKRTTKNFISTLNQTKKCRYRSIISTFI
jgi:site-specific recombinase XerD